MGCPFRRIVEELYFFQGFKLCDINLVQKQIKIYLKRRRKTGVCSECGTHCRIVEEAYAREARDLDIAGTPVVLCFDVFKVRCRCGYRGVEKLEFIDKYSQYTTRFEEYVAQLCEKMCLTDVCRVCGIAWRRAKAIDKKYLLKQIVDLAQITPKRIGVDEVAYEKGHKYLTVVRDVDLGKVIWVGIARKKETLDAFFLQLGTEKSRAIRIAVIDMWDPFIASIKEHCPLADIVFDKFHVAKKVNEAVDAVRKHEFSNASTEERKEMKHKRFLILSREKNLDEQKKDTLAVLMEQNKTLYTAYLLKEQILDVLDEKNQLMALQRLSKWVQNIELAGIEEFKGFLKTLKNYMYGVWNYFKHQVTNAGSEGFNNKIGVIKRRAYGFHDLEYFKLKILQTCGARSS
ncbi:MAG: ISL3 family transposase [Candidatus Aenigmarchaeota archaeon]|nr:ISL3 family transposase [Candidatus Aenigmarchaeota archaeon]